MKEFTIGRNEAQYVGLSSDKIFSLKYVVFGNPRTPSLDKMSNWYFSPCFSLYRCSLKIVHWIFVLQGES